MSKRLCVIIMSSILLGAGIAAQAATTFWAGTSIGPYKSTDGGASWQFVSVTTSNSLLQGNPQVLSIALDPQQPSTVYFVGNAGATAFFTSKDGGSTWSAVTLIGVIAGTSNTWLVIDPVHTNVMFLGAGAKLRKSSDYGATWTLITNLPNLPASTGNEAASVEGLSVDPKVSGTVYVTVGGVFIDKSTDFGATWQALTPVIQGRVSPSVGNVVVDPKNSKVLYVGDGFPYVNGSCGADVTTEQDCGLFRSADGGHSWANVAPAGIYRNIVFDSRSSDLYVSANVDGIGHAVLKSSDNGNSWNPINNKVNAPLLVADPDAGGSLLGFIGYPAGGQIYKSTDGGANWTSITLPSQNFAFPAIYGLAVPAKAAAGPPVISTNGVVNGASFQPGIVPNSWVTILGTNLASTTDDWNNSIVNGQFPTTLDNVSVSIGGQPAYINFVSPTQINLLAPDVGFGSLPLTVTTLGGTTASFLVTSNQYGPAFFLWPNNQPVATRRDFTYAVKNGTFPGTTTAPAKPGDVIILWGTGFGPTDPLAPAGAVVPSDKTYSTSTLPAILINNVPVTVYGAALAPGFAGLYQIAIQIPSTLADGDFPIQASIGGAQSPAGTIFSVHQ